MSVDKASRPITDRTFFGFIGCDILVPEWLEEKISEMAPIFKRVILS